MKLNRIPVFSFAVAVVLTVGGSPALADQSRGSGELPKPSDKWRVEVDGRARSDGKVELRITPNQGTPTTVTIAIVKNRGENDIAKDIRDALSAQLATGRYEIEIDDGEDVLLKKLKGQPDFTVELGSSSITGIELNVEHD